MNGDECVPNNPMFWRANWERRPNKITMMPLMHPFKHCPTGLRHHMLHGKAAEILPDDTIPIPALHLPLLTAQVKFFIRTIATVIIPITFPRWPDTHVIFTFEHSSRAICTIGEASGCWWREGIFKLLEKDTGFEKVAWDSSFSSFHYSLLFLIQDALLPSTAWNYDGIPLSDHCTIPVFKDTSHSVDGTGLSLYRRGQLFSCVSTGLTHHPFIQFLWNQVLICGNHITNNTHHG